MVRLRSTSKFAFSAIIGDTIGIIPRFSFGNLNINHLRYSDHPYIVHRSFFTRFGFYLENTSTYYGENEYMVRMMKLKPKIGLLVDAIVEPFDLEGSVNESINFGKGKQGSIKKWIKKFAQYLRFEWETFNYNQFDRSLKTYPNKRKG